MQRIMIVAFVLPIVAVPGYAGLTGSVYLTGTLAHELGHALVEAEYCGGIDGVQIDLFPPKILFHCRNGKCVDIHVEFPIGFVTIGPYDPGTPEEELRKRYKEVLLLYVENPVKFFDNVSREDAEVTMAGPVVGALISAALSPLDPQGAFDSAWNNLLNLIPVEIHGALTDGKIAWEALIRDRYPVDRYLIELGLVTLSVLITAAQCPRYALETVESEFVLTLEMAPIALLDDLSKAVLGGLLGLTVKLREPFFVPGIGVGWNLSLLGPEYQKWLFALLDTLEWSLTIPWLGMPWKLYAVILKLIDATADLDPGYPSLGSYLGYLKVPFIVFLLVSLLRHPPSF
ncbi:MULTISPECIES: hypothetical protein [unclassified Methanopyrus]|uniref:hypothetical protein n=1 Tax=Methanopyrus sp. SNP6 TaxID=1937005 RepID=UPI0011E5897A|nr:hypothetical protein [Methanopyrus sp. SNP6]